MFPCVEVFWTHQENLSNFVAENSHLAIDPIASMGLMIYLPTFAIKNQPMLGKYTIDGWYGDDYPWIAIVLVKFKGWSLSTCHYIEYLGIFWLPADIGAGTSRSRGSSSASAAGTMAGASACAGAGGPDRCPKVKTPQTCDNGKSTSQFNDYPWMKKWLQWEWNIYIYTVI